MHHGKLTARALSLSALAGCVLAAVGASVHAADVTFGTIEFEPPTPRGEVTITSIEFETPSTGDVTFGEITFTSPEMAAAEKRAAELGKSLQNLQQKHRQTMENIDRSLDELERDRKRKAGPREPWLVDNIAGGTPAKGTVRGVGSGPGPTGSVYSAPAQVPPMSVVTVQVDVPDQGGTRRLPAEVTILDATALLEARWTYEESMVRSHHRQTPGPFGDSGKDELSQHHVRGSGRLRFIESAPKDEEARRSMATASNYGYRSLYLREFEGSAGISGSGTGYEFSPSKQDRSSDSIHGTGHTSATAATLSPTPANGYVNFKKEGNGFRIIEWSAENVRPVINATEFVAGISRNKTQDSRAQWYWRSTPWQSTRDRRVTLEPASPTGTWGDAPKRPVVLRPAGEGKFTGSVSFEDRRPSFSDGNSSLTIVRTATWQFTLTLVDP